MECKIDLTKEYGIVLEGGGAKGAYEIGAWKALREAGIRIKGISGTSVGALNGAFICMNNLEKAEEIWKNIHYSQIMSVEDEWMDCLMKKDFKNLTIYELIKDGLACLLDGGFDVTPLRTLIEECVDEEKLRSGSPEFYFQVFSVTEMKDLEIDAREVEEGQMTDMILAGAYFPIFKKERVKGDKLIDAGMFNNVPVDALLKRGYQDIIIIRIYGVGLERKVEIPEGTTILEIAPRVQLGSMMEFDSKISCRNMEIGYFDAMRLLYDLKGTIYYINSIINEAECLRRFLNPSSDLYEVFDLYHIDNKEDRPPNRNVLERLLPALADKLKLEKNWSYYDLYLAMTEASAKQLHIQKYRVYTEIELIDEIKRRWECLSEETKHKFPEFIPYLLAT